MANRRDPLQDRKLRPLYDALDNLNNKQAVQRADKLLKKEKDFHCAKVLKALALVRMLRVKDATAILDEVKQLPTLDENTLQAMSVCYKELLAPEEIPDLYEKALKSNPTNEDFMTQLFMAYVRLKDYRSQQKIATKLHKLTSNTAYSYWNAMSLLLMGKENVELGKVMCFPLALKIVEKSKEKREDVGEEVFRLYLKILEVMNMHEKALEELEKRSNNIVDERERMRLQLHFNKILGNTEKQNILYKQAIRIEPHSYQNYVGYFDTSFQVIDLSVEEQLHDEVEVDYDSPDRTVNDMTAFILKCSESGNLRAPELAKVDLVLRLKEKGITMCSFASPTLLLLQYVQKFGHKMCCYSYITTMLDRLDEEEKNQLIEILETYRVTVKETNGNKSMQRLATIHQILNHIGRYENLPREQLNLAQEEIWNFHQITLEEDLGCQFIDTFAMLYAWLKSFSRSNTDILDALKCLGSKIEKYPETAGCRLLSTKLYEHLGAIGPAVEMHMGLETKSIQLDSCAHLMYPSLIPLGGYIRADKHIRQMEAFYRTSEREVIEYVVKSYYSGKFDKITDLFGLHHSFVHSISRAIATADKLWLTFVLATPTNWDTTEPVVLAVKEEMGSLRRKNLQDNRDFLCNDLCDGKRALYIQCQQQLSYKHDSLYVALRYFMLASLIELYDVSSGMKKELQIEALVGEFEREVVDNVGELDKIKDLPPYLIITNSMSVWKHYTSFVGSFVSFSSKFLQNLTLNDTSELDLEDVQIKFREILNLCRTSVLSEDGELNSCNIAHLSTIAQVLNFAVYLCSCTLTTRGSKKKRSIVDNVVGMLKSMCTHTLELLDMCSTLALNYKLQSLNLNKEDGIDSRIGSSIEWSMEEITSIVKKLLPLVSALTHRPQFKA